MCGIVGIITTHKRTLIPNVISSLRDLEYRGYDSAGIGFIADGRIQTYKCLGAPSENLHAEDVYTKTKLTDRKISIAIGHNRWATHGKPSIKNAHPHIDCTGRVALVHNGMILNFESLKEMLEKKGHHFNSDTDTEVIAHVIEENLKSTASFDDAFLAAIRMLQGSFGIVAIDRDDPDHLYVAKNGSPINIGMADDTFIVASSTNALFRYTKEYVSLSDHEYAILSTINGTLKQEVYQFEQETCPAVTKEVHRISGVTAEDLSKGDFTTYMQKEIYEQPATTRATILGRYNQKTGDAVLGGLIDFDAFFKKVEHMYFVGCGTAYNAGVVGRHIIERLAKINVRNEIASELKYETRTLPTDTTAVFAISQSGETADTLEALKEVRRKGYTTFGIVNVVGSALVGETDAGIYTHAGAEIGVASTKAFMSQLAVLYLLGLKLARMKGMLFQEGKSYLSELDRMPEYMKTTLELDSAVEKIAKKFRHIKNISFLGRGIHVPIANEAALKFKELTYIEAGSYPLGELKHGPIAVVDEHSLSVIIMPKDNLFAVSKNSIEQIQSKGGHVLIITDASAKNDPIVKKADAVLFVPTLLHDIFYPLLEIIPLQLFAYHFATQLGMNVDKPRNLAKSVTVE